MQASEVKETPNQPLRFSPIFAAQCCTRHTEEGAGGLGCHGLGEHCLTGPFKSEIKRVK